MNGQPRVRRPASRKRGVPLGTEQGKDEIGLGLDGHRPTVSSLALGHYIARRKRLRCPSDRAGRPDLEMRRSLTPRHAAIDSINHTLAKIGRERFRHVSQPPSPANTIESEIQPNSGILRPILSGREMLRSSPNDRYLRLPAEDPVAVKQSVRRATVDVAAGVRTFAAL